ncbi:hypothetical protein ACIQZB_43205 [Streptomyces sp. NPDC097727]|uniref:hypothetical protein n=1 Tax=Streptomyces sp. NPDC097727 TaxID=3366092 RepID=UPI0037F3841B
MPLPAPVTTPSIASAGGGRAQRTTNGGSLIREARHVDEAAVVELLGRVQFTRPETGAEIAHDMTHGHPLDPFCACGPLGPPSAG